MTTFYRHLTMKTIKYVCNTLESFSEVIYHYQKVTYTSEDIYVELANKFAQKMSFEFTQLKYILIWFCTFQCNYFILMRNEQITECLQNDLK